MMTRSRLVTKGILVAIVSAAAGLSFAQKAPKKPAAAKAPAPAPAAAKPSPPSRWKPIGPWIGDVQTVAVDPRNSQNIFAGVGNGGVFRCTDAGATWKASADMANEDVRRLAVDPSNPNHVLAGTNGGGLWASRDGGVTFRWQGPGGMGAVLYELGGGREASSSRQTAARLGRKPAPE
jgi:hypothetical protein